MRELAGSDQVRRFMRELGRACPQPARVYFTGGASAVLLGWRETTLDLDIKIVTGEEPILQAIPRLKDELRLNVELAAPDQFIPPLPGWETRSLFIADEGRVSFLHYDFYSQALAKLERGHRVDLADVGTMIDRRLVKPERLLEFFREIEPELYRYPAVSPTGFRKSVESFLRR